MQTEGVVSLPPVIPYPIVLLDHECRDVQCLQPGSNPKPALTASDEQHRGSLGLVFLGPSKLCSCFPGREPVRIGRVKVPESPDLLWEADERIEVREHDVRLPLQLVQALDDRRAVDWLLLRERHEPRDPRAVSGLGLEGEHQAEPDEVGERRLELGEGLVEREVGELRDGEAGVEEGGDRGLAGESAEVPSEGEHVAPEGGGWVEEIEDLLCVGIGAGGGDGGKPRFGDGLSLGWGDRWKGGYPCAIKGGRGDVGERDHVVDDKKDAMMDIAKLVRDRAIPWFANTGN